MRVSKKLPSEVEMMGWLSQYSDQLHPLKITRAETKPRNHEFDAVIECSLGGHRSFRFAVECKAVSTPKVLSAAINQIKKAAANHTCHPMVFVPFLSEEQLRFLEREEVSGIDMCGNGVVIVAEKLFFYKCGAPNRFSSSAPIKNIYRKSSSLVGRTFLVRPSYNSLQDLSSEIKTRGGQLTLATISKVCSELDKQLIIETGLSKEPRAKYIRIIQPDKLLSLLEQNYSPPRISVEMSGDCSLSRLDLQSKLGQWEKLTGERVVRTGRESVANYATMARNQIEEFYCTDANKLRGFLVDSMNTFSHFRNIRLLETREDFVYFDRQDDLSASPVQVYLELALGDKRERESAEQVRDHIFQSLHRDS